MIDIKDLIKDYERTRALKGISFNVSEGSFFALLGPNGAGKSTTIEIISTLKRESSGSVSVNGACVGDDDETIRRSIGVVFQYSTLDDVLTVRENLEIRGRFYKLEKARLKQRIDALSETLGIDSLLERRVGTLSGGERRKSDIARALLHDPKVLLLDEPTTGLDPKSREDLWELILKLKNQTNMTIVLTTHYMEEVSDCDHVVVLHEGNVEAEDSADKLRARFAKDKVRIIPKDEALAERLQKDAVEYHAVQSTLHVPVDSSFDGLEIVERYKDHIETFEIVKGTMDDVFLAITGRKLSDLNVAAD